LNRYEVVQYQITDPASTTINTNTDSIGQIPITLIPPGSPPTPNVYTFCVDLFNQVAYGTNQYNVTPSLTPSGAGMPHNADRIAYLYNHYGTTLRPNSIDAAALQVAIWELEYGSNFNALSGILPYT